MSASEPTQRQRRISRRRAAWIGAAVILAVVIGLPTITLGRLQARILRLLAQELGRPVTAQSVHLVLVPWPGVELDQVRLDDAPAFGGEAMATAEEARATVRIWALFAGRLEFSSVQLEDANVNLARDAAGQWNLAQMLSEASRHSPRLRPTAAPASLARPDRFPYLDIRDSRVNFKFGLKKEPFYLADVDGSLQLAHNGWRFHLEFSPQRSDLNLSDTGRVTADGVWRRAAASRGKPFRDRRFDLSAHWRQAYLAAASSLAVGQDEGVHGVARVDVRIQGTGRKFRISGVAVARQLRRWDRLPSGLRMRAPFSAVYNSGSDALRLTQLGNGSEFDVQGTVLHVLTRPEAMLTVTVRGLRSAALLPLAHAMDPNLPPDLTASGKWSGQFAIRGGQGRRWTAEGRIAAPHAGLREGALRLSLTAPVCATQPGSGSHAIVCQERAARVAGPDRANAQVAITARWERRGVAWRAEGSAVTVPAVAALGQLCGVAAPWPYQLAGKARMAFTREVSWSRIRGFSTQAPPPWQGTAYFRRAALRLPVLAAPLPIRDLRWQMGPRRAFAISAEANLGGTAWRLAVRREAAQAAWRFQLGAAQVSLRRLAAALRPQQPHGLWARLFSHPASWLPLLQLVHARGTVAVAALRWRGQQAKLEASVLANGAVWRLPRLRLALAGGQLRAKGVMRRGRLGLAGTAQGLDMAALLAPSRYAGAVSGRGTMQLRLSWPLRRGWRDMTVTGALQVAPGAFPIFHTAAGRELRFHAYRTQFRWQAGQLQLHDGRLWLRAGAQPAQVRLRLRPPAPPRLEWAPASRRRAVAGAWPRRKAPVRASLGRRGPAHAHR